MRILRLVLARCRALVRRDVVSDEIREEMQFHLEMRTEEYVRNGLPAADARRAASRRFGNLAVMQDRGYDVRGGGITESVVQDVRYGIRLLLAHRAFSTIAILTLAMGIGLSTALFSVIDSALLRPLPYPNPEELVEISVADTTGPKPRKYGPSLADIRAWRDSARTMTHVGAGRVQGFVPHIVDAGEPERLVVGDASEDFLEVYGIKPHLGRGIHIADTRAGAPLVALLGHGYWQSRFGGTADVLGRTIRIAGVPATIVGVLPAGFYRETAVWKPIQLPTMQRRGSGTPVIGRLRQGVSLAQAKHELTRILKTTPHAPGESTDVRAELSWMYDEETSGKGRTIKPLASAVVLILLIACVNVAALLLARGAIREPELAIRASIGAGRRRLVRQLLTESLILSCAGGFVGVILAWVSLDALVAMIPMSLPANSPPAMNLSVLGFAATLSVLSSVLIGLVPALRVSRARMGAQLASSRRHGSALSRRGGQLLIAAEVSLAVILLAGAGLMVRSFARLAAVDVGFDPGPVLTMEVEPVDPARHVRELYYPALLDVLRRMPDVEVAGAVDFLPMRDGIKVGFVEAAGQTNIYMKEVLPGYFEAIGLPLKLGRLPSESDRTNAEHLALINEEAARLLFPDASAIGRSLRMMGSSSSRRVIGVVGDVRHYGPLWPPAPEIYTLYGQSGPESPLPPLRIVLRPRSWTALSGDRLRDVAQGIGPTVFVGRIRRGTDDFSQSVITPRRRTVLLSLLGALGLLLTLVGILSMTAYAVARRTQEIGVRMAFGAAPRDVVRTMVRDAVWPACLGLAAGLTGALFATRVIASFLFETPSHDPGTFAAVTLLVGVAALAAAWVPARRAARVDPVIALRAE